MQDQVVPVLTLVGLAILLWLLLIRPAQRRNRELARMQSTLEVGDDVMLTSGVYGVLRSIDDFVMHVEIADGVVIKVARRAVGEILTPPDAADAPEQTGDRDVSEEN